MVTKIVNFRIDAKKYEKFKKIIGNDRGKIAKEFRNFIERVIKEPKRARRESQAMELLRTFRDASTRVEEWFLKKLYQTCPKCRKPKIPGKDLIELYNLGARDMVKKCCLCHSTKSPT